jgi:hypothetical protein
MMTATEKRFRANLREVRRLQVKLATGAGRNSGATEAALDRRLEADGRLLRQLAEEEA